MEIGLLIFTLLFGVGYLTVIVIGLVKNKAWAHDIARTLALMEPSRSYMDYHHLARSAKPRRATVEELTGGRDNPPDRLAA